MDYGQTHLFLGRNEKKGDILGCRNQQPGMSRNLTPPTQGRLTQPEALKNVTGIMTVWEHSMSPESTTFRTAHPWPPTS